LIWISTAVANCQALFAQRVSNTTYITPVDLEKSGWRRDHYQGAQIQCEDLLGTLSLSFSPGFNQGRGASQRNPEPSQR